MVARPGTYQASLNAGELAPAVWGRSDIKQFYSGASLMRNAEPVPQGGFRALPGSVDAGEVRGPLTAQAGSLAFSPGPFTTTGVVATLTLAAIQPIGAVQLEAFSSTIPLGAILRVETSPDNVAWTPFDVLFASNQSANLRRAAPPGAPVQARFIRLVLTAAPPAAVTFALGAMTAFSEAAGAPLAARQFSFAANVADNFVVLVTTTNCDIYNGDTWVAAAPIAYTAAQLEDIKTEQRYDTLLILHPDVAPTRLRRVNERWIADSQPFGNLPNVDYGEAYGNVTPDDWFVTIRYSQPPAGLILDCTVNGEATTGVTLAAGPDWTGFAAALQSAIVALPSVGPGVVVTVPFADASAAVVQITFSGAGNAGSRFAVVPRVTNVSWASAVASNVGIADPGGEPIMSAGRGWPVTAAFYQDRLFLGGFRSEPAALLGSNTGEYYDLNTRVENAAGGVLVRLDTRGGERIEHLAQARHLVIFTNEGEYYVSDRAIVRGTPPNIPQSSRNGCAARIRPVENDGDLIYVGGSRAIVYAAAFDDVRQVYASEPISLLATHLCVGFRAMARQKASESTDAARLWMVRDDGLMVVGIMIRNQDVMAFVRFVTDGQVKDVCVDGANRPYMLVARPVGAGVRWFRERLAADAVMHQERRLSFGVPTSLITGLAAYEGRTVWVSADGYYDRAYVVTGGQITLDQPALSVTIGRWTAPDVRTLPVPRMVGERTQLARPVRVHTVRARLLGAASIAIGANGRPARDVPLTRAGDTLDQPVQPVEREVIKTGIAGYSPDGVVQFTQVRPGPFVVRSITIETRS